MAKIRQFNILHFFQLTKMLKNIAPDEKISFFMSILGVPADLIQNFLPLALRKAPESYIAINDKNEVQAFVTLDASYKNKKKWFIKRLFLNPDSYDEGKQLTDYVVAKYGALGVDTFCVLIDENDNISADLFSKMCGFRLCSREVVWKMTDFDIDNSSYKKEEFILFKNSDAKIASDFYNDSIAIPFRFSVKKEPSEFKESLFKGLYNVQSFKFLLLSDKKNIKAFAEIQSINNVDWLIDLILNKPYDEEYLDILKAIIKIVKNRNKKSNIFILNRNYMTCSNNFEELLIKNNFEKIQSKVLLVKDFYKPISNKEKISNPAVIFNEFSGKPAFLLQDSLQKTIY